MKKLSFILLLFVTNMAFAQYTLIPDEYFELHLISAGIDSDGIINGQVLTSDIEDELSLGFLFEPITDLTGIEDFASLEVLDITVMDISSINLSQNSNLRNLSISDVSLESLDLSSNINLNQLFIELDSSISTYTSSITDIDLSNNLLLDYLTIAHTFITHIDLYSNINLTHLELNGMDELVYVGIKNGMNEQLTFLQLVDNPNFLCFEVDDPAAVIAGVDPPYNNWIIENNPVITDDCSLGISGFDQEGSLSIHPNPAKSIVNIDNHAQDTILSIHLYDAAGRLVLEVNEDVREIDISRLESGLFFLEIETTEGVLTEKVIKE